MREMLFNEWVSAANRYRKVVDNCFEKRKEVRHFKKSPKACAIKVQTSSLVRSSGDGKKQTGGTSLNVQMEKTAHI